jgi:sulfur-oxidizing protein SoxA
MFKTKITVQAIAAALAMATVAGVATAGDSKGFGPLEMSRPAYAGEWKRHSDWTKNRWDSFPTLASTPERKGATPSFEGLAGDPVRGKAVAEDQRKGNCYACHTVGKHGFAKGDEMPGNVGPDLSAIGERGDPAYLRSRISDPSVLNPMAIMPRFGADGILNAQEIEDIVAWLSTTKGVPEFKTPLDDPNKRPSPVESRDWRDEFVNPAASEIAVGKSLFSNPGPAGKACVSCHTAPERTFSTWAATMPKPEPRMGGKILGVEEFIARHAPAVTGAEHPMMSAGNVALSIYLRSLADGATIAVDTESPYAKAAAARGKALTERRIGQLNFACQGCHTTGSGKFMRGQWLGALDTGTMTTHFPTHRTSKTENWDLRKRFQWCNVQGRANELPPDAPEYGDLEIYLTGLAKGKKLNAPGIRH